MRGKLITHCVEETDHLDELSQQVVHHSQRVQIDLPDGSGACVMISKQELDSIEAALDILSDTDGMRDVCKSIEALVEACRDRAPA